MARADQRLVWLQRRKRGLRYNATAQPAWVQIFENARIPPGAQSARSSCSLASRVNPDHDQRRADQLGVGASGRPCRTCHARRRRPGTAAVSSTEPHGRPSRVSSRGQLPIGPMTTARGDRRGDQRPCGRDAAEVSEALAGDAAAALAHEMDDLLLLTRILLRVDRLRVLRSPPALRRRGAGARQQRGPCWADAEQLGRQIAPGWTSASVTTKPRADTITMAGNDGTRFCGATLGRSCPSATIRCTVLRLGSAVPSWSRPSRPPASSHTTSTTPSAAVASPPSGRRAGDTAAGRPQYPPPAYTSPSEISARVSDARDAAIVRRLVDSIITDDE